MNVFYEGEFMKINLLDYQSSSLHDIVKKHYQLDDQSFEELLDFTMSDPLDIQNMKECLQILQDIQRKKEKILICGDYDCDGICATAILCIAFEAIQLDYGFYIPHRIQEGYGLSVETLKKALEKGYTSIITVDNGVGCKDAMQFAKENKMRFILTDHHKYDMDNINCDCMIHPFLNDDAFKNCCGAGMALQVARCFIPDNKEIVALAAIATLADCMPVTQENRKIIKNGIDYLNDGCCPAIHALKNKPEDILDMKTITYSIIPKINSMGRLADKVNTNNAVRYLLLKDNNTILNVAAQINHLNDERKQMTSSMEKTALGEIENVPFEIICHKDFHEGIVGLVASKMASQFNRPFLILSELEDEYKGSMRSIEGFDLVDYFKEFDGFSSFGGHAQAAGVSLKKEKLQELKNYIQTHEMKIEDSEKTMDAVLVDEEMLSLQEVSEYLKIAPFGNGFEEINFYIDSIHIRQRIPLSNGRFMKIISYGGIEYLLFKSSLLEKVKEDMKVIGKLKISYFKGQYQVNVIVDEIIEDYI